MPGINNKKRVLIVDDAVFARTIIKKVIAELDYAEVIGEASDGYEAIEAYKNLKPDLITMDLVMPEKGGIEAIEEILKINNSVKILVVSAVGQEHLIMEATEKGAKDFIQKPINKEELKRSIDNLLLNK
ncbi:MAG: response regulator [Promethearchaeota archaeon]